MRAAAVAASHGWDPLRYLALDEDDLHVANAVIEQQARMRDERDKGMADYAASKTAGLTAGAITKWFGKNLSKVIHGH